MSSVRSGPSRVLAWAVGGLLGSAFAVAWMMQALSDRDTQQGELQRLLQRYASAVEAKVHAPILRQQNVEFRLMLQEFETRLPDAPATESLIALLGEQIEMAGLELESVEAGPRTEHEFFGARDLQLTARGAPATVYASIPALLAASPIRRFTSVSLQRTSHIPDVLELQVELRIYDYASP